ncbi:MAG: hypothetical protein PHQ40_09510 [Anaerolineaceae bacterium]|nr:hypothetical protein [Anaerolineaceae bacterium]
MAEIRCPMCGRLNPADLEVCVHCQARLKPMTHPPAPPTPPSPAPTPDEAVNNEVPDWLQSLRTNSENGEVEPVSPFQVEGDGSEGEPDWLGRLRDFDAPETPERPVQPFEGGEEAGESSEDDGIPDWLKPVRQRAFDDGLKDEPPLGVANLAATESAEPEQDWLRRLGEIQPETPEKTQEPAGEEMAFQADMPDWLAKISELKANEPEPEGIPDRTQDNAFSLPAEDVSQALPPHEAEQPAAEIPTNPPENRLPEEPTPNVLPPDETPGESEPTPPPAPAPGESELPDQPAVEPQGPQWEPDWTPDWLAKLEANAPSGLQTSFDSPAPLILGDARAERTPPPSREKLPEWLEQPGKTPAPPAGNEPPGEQASGDEPIVPADLPIWVQAMRPVESVAPTPLPENSADPHIEAQGPLAGLRGILPSEPAAADFRQPTRYATLLEVSERQRDHSEMFQKLLASEAEPEPAPGKPLVSTSRLLRMALALALFAVVLFPIAAHTHIVPIPDAIPQETLWANETVDSLSTNDPVLLVIDYSPSLAGELEVAASGVIDHLMARGARLAVISSTPTGSALAARLFNRLYAEPAGYMTGYISGEKVVDLGYLAGGTTGLAAFARQPKEAAYYDLSGEPAWDRPALQGVTGLTDFTQIVLLTDNVDTARAWVEQVRAHMSPNGAFVVTSSSQAAPVLRAYLDSGQVQGMVAGLAGGAAYEQMLQRPSTGRAYWDAYQAGAWAAIVIILAGALFNAFWPLWKDRKPVRKAAA